MVIMKIEGKKINRTIRLLNLIKVRGLKPTELEELADLSAYFLFVAKASDYVTKEEKQNEK